MKPQIYAVAVTILILPQLIGCSKPVSTPVPPAVKKLLPVRWIAAVDLEDLQSVEAALDRRVKMPDGEPLVLRKGIGDEAADTRSVTTGREWRKALKDGYGAYWTGDVTLQSWFEFTVGTIMLLTNAQPSVVSYVSDFTFGTNALYDMPCTLNTSWEQHIEMALESGRTFADLPADWDQPDERYGLPGYYRDSSPRYAAVFPDAVVGEHSSEEVEFLLGTEDWGHRILLKLVAWGDFDGDGIEDLLMQNSTYYRGGSGRYYTHVVLTRLTPTGALVERPVPSMFGAVRPEGTKHESI
ncbi:MAG: hypothetical protein O3C69_05905 [Chloroflexi bacterium]|nr:hypothetical protein [Chloroflexota bacterium]